MGEVIRFSDYHYKWKQVFALDAEGSTLHVYVNEGTGEVEVVQMNDDNETIRTARMAIAGADPTDRETLHAAEYMPPTLAEFQAAKAANKWEHDFIAKYMENITDELAEKFYVAEYTMKQMNADLKLIMSVMHTA